MSDGFEEGGEAAFIVFPNMVRRSLPFRPRISWIGTHARIFGISGGKMIVKGAEGRKEAHVSSPLKKIFVRFSFYMFQIVNVNSPWRKKEGEKVKDFFLLEAGSSHAKGTHMGDAIGRKDGRTPLPPRKKGHALHAKKGEILSSPFSSVGARRSQ